MSCKGKGTVFNLAVTTLTCGAVLCAGTARARPLLKYAPTPLLAAESCFLTEDNGRVPVACDGAVAGCTDKSIQAWSLCLKSYAGMELKQPTDALNALNAEITQYGDVTGATADAYLQSAYIKQSQGDSEGASQAFDKAKASAQSLLGSAQDAATKHLAHMILAEVYFGQCDSLKAIDEARAAITAYPHSEYPTDFAPIDVTTSYSQESPTDQAAYAKLMIGLGYAVKGRLYPGAAVEIYKELLTSYPGTKACAETQFRLGEGYYLLGRMSDANAALDMVSANYHSSDKWCAWSHYLKGVASVPTEEMSLEHPEIAKIPVNEWDAVTGMYYSQTQQMVRTRLGQVEFLDIPSGKYAYAEDELQQIRSGYPELSVECTYAKSLLALSDLKQFKYDDAIALCNEILTLPAGKISDRQIMRTQYCKGLACNANGDADGAIVALSAALSITTDPGMLLNIRTKLAESYGAKGDKTNLSVQLDAIEGNILLEDQTRVLALYKKGTYLLNLGDKDGAKVAFHGVQAKYPTNYLSVRAVEQLAKMDKAGA